LCGLCLTLNDYEAKRYGNEMEVEETTIIFRGTSAALPKAAGEESLSGVIASDFTLLARGASNAKWRDGCLAPDRYVESIL
jgi:hypothetical protein